MKLDRAFYQRDTLDVAAALLGKVLLRRLNGRTLGGTIIETEAYVGPHDLACHASKGRTTRTDVMFGAGGAAYVYLIYGMYHCLNVVTEAEGFPAAVLIRALEPTEGVPAMRRLRGGVTRDTDIASGPGKLCMALSIDRTLNGSDLTGSKIWIEDRLTGVPRVETSPRVGVDYAGEYRDKPWRFFIPGNPHVSKVRFS